MAILALEAWGLQRLGRSARSTDPNTNLESSSRVGSSVVLANPMINCVAVSDAVVVIMVGEESRRVVLRRLRVVDALDIAAAVLTQLALLEKKRDRKRSFAAGRHLRDVLVVGGPRRKVSDASDCRPPSSPTGVGQAPRSAN